MKLIKSIFREYDIRGTYPEEINEDSISKGDKVLLVDDLIATGFTSMATAEIFQ